MDNVVAFAELIAAIGVIVSVIYLAIQVRDSNHQIRQQASSETLNLMHSPIEEMIASSELSEIIRVGNMEPDKLSEAEWFRYSFWWMMGFDMYEYLFTAQRRGTVDANTWQGTDASFRNVFEVWPRTCQAWREWRHAYSDPFQNYVDGLVTDGEEAALAGTAQSG